MRKILGTIGACIALATSSASWATSVGFSATLTNISAIGDGRTVLQFGTTTSSCSGTPQGFYVTVGQNGVSADGAKQILATALLAFSLGKTLTIYFDDSTSYCYVGQATIVQ
jgi:hypothetical protein